MVRAWLDGLPRDSLALSVVLNTDPGWPENDSWARIQSDLGTPSAKPAVARRGSAFQRLCASISASDRKVVLILDLGESVSDPVSRVDALLDSAPDAGLKIVWVTRSSDPHLEALVRRRRHKFVSREDMAFDAGDIAATLRHLGLEFDGRALDAIHDATGGLADLVNAACTMVPTEHLTNPTHLAAHARAAVDSFIDRSLRTDPNLAPHHDAILLSAAATPLKRGPARLAEEAAPSGTTSVPLFETLIRSGLANVAGSPTETILRFPDPVRESLLRLAMSTMPDRLRDYRVALVDYWLAHDRPDYSVRHAADAELWDTAVEIMAEHLGALYTRDYPVALIEQVLMQIPEDILSKHPTLVATRGVLTQFASPRGGLPTVPNTRTAVSDEADVTNLIIEMTSLRLEGRFTESADIGDEILKSLVAEPEFPKSIPSESWAFFCVHIGISFILTGRFLDALPILRHALQICDNSFIQRDAAGKLALCNTFIANHEEAQRWITAERQAPTLPPDTEQLIRPAGDVAAALTALDQLDIDSAAAILHDLGTPDDREEFWAFILYAHASHALLSGSAAEGLRFLELHRARYNSTIDENSVAGPLLSAISAELLLACDQPEAAAARVGGAPHPITAPVRARIALLTDDPKGAEDLARRSLMAIECTARDAVDLGLTAAAALLADGQHDQAKRFLDNAVASIKSSGFLRPVRTLPPRVLRELALVNPALPIESELARPEFGTLNLGESEAPSEVVPTSPILTPREYAVLRDLTTEASVREISIQHSVSVSTIKSQVRSIYRKLGVNSRPAAVASAREFGLLE